MSSRRKKRKPKRAERQRRREERTKNEFEDVVLDTAATFTCPHEIAHDFAWQCGHGIQELEGDILFSRIAQEIWRDQTGEARELAQAVNDLLAERERHRDRLEELKARFEKLADEDSHEHLEPIETYRQLVRERLTASLSFPQEQERPQMDENASRLSDLDGF